MEKACSTVSPPIVFCHSMADAWANKLTGSCKHNEESNAIFCNSFFKCRGLEELIYKKLHCCPNKNEGNQNFKEYYSTVSRTQVPFASTFHSNIYFAVVHGLHDDNRCLKNQPCFYRSIVVRFFLLQENNDLSES